MVNASIMPNVKNANHACILYPKNMLSMWYAVDRFHASSKMLVLGAEVEGVEMDDSCEEYPLLEPPSIWCEHACKLLSLVAVVDAACDDFKLLLVNISAEYLSCEIVFDKISAPVYLAERPALNPEDKEPSKCTLSKTGEYIVFHGLPPKKTEHSIDNKGSTHRGKTKETKDHI